MTGETVLAAVAIAFLAAACMSVTGFGFALVMTPLLTIAWNVKPAVATSILLSTLTLFPLLVEVRGHVSLPRVSLLFLGSILGVPPGVFLLESLDPDTLRIIVAATVLVATFLLYLRPAPHSSNDSNDPVLLRLTAGFLSGALGSSTSLGAPPIALYLLGRKLEVRSFRATILAFFLPANILALIAFALVGQISRDVLLLSAAALPAVALGLASGAWLRHRLDPERFRALVVAILISSSIAVLLSASGALG